MIGTAISKISQGNNLTEQETYEAIQEIMNGQASEIEIAAFLTGLRVKGETSEELTGGVRSMLTSAVRIKPAVRFCVDPVGTGGDRTGTVNISSAAALVATAAGACVAKHGNRSVSSKSGSADFFEALGFDLTLSPQEVTSCIETYGFGFLYAPLFHPAMRFAASVRRQLKIRSIFNILGPLTNPAGASGQLLGVYDPAIMPYVARTLVNLDVRHAMIVHGSDGSDEITISGPTDVIEVRDGQTSRYRIHPESFGIEPADLADVRGDSPEENVRRLLDVFAGRTGPVRDMVLLNAAATLYVGQVAVSLQEGFDKARIAIDQGLVLQKIDLLRRVRHQEKAGA